MSQKTTPIILLIILLLSVSVGAYFYFTKNKIQIEPVESSIDPVELIVFEVKLDNLSDYQKEQSFARFTAAKNIISKSTDEGKDIKDDANFYAWLEIASVQKTIGDYDRAAELWAWHTDVYPGNSVSPANLGELYKSTVVNPSKSEYYYKIALEREDHDFQIFLGLYDLYRYRLEDADKAIDILRKGIALNPESRNYVTELANYLIELDRRSEAEEILDAWIENHPEDFSLKSKLSQ